MSTLLLQIHNLGYCGVGPVLAIALFYGGLAQIIVGAQEFKTGNNFAYSVFMSFGCFWMSFGFLLIANKYGLYTASKTDVGWFLVVWTAYAVIMGIGSLRTNKMLIGAFVTVDVGLFFLIAEHFGAPEWTGTLAAICMLGTVACVWYGMAHVVFQQLFGRDVLPVGKPII